MSASADNAGSVGGVRVGGVGGVGGVGQEGFAAVPPGSAEPIGAGPGDGQLAVDRLVALLDLEPIDTDIFRGGNPESTPLSFVFGGQVAAQALMAAGRTVEADRSVHSLHAYFIRRGDPTIPIVFTVDRIRDGNSFSMRRVLAVQHGQAIFALSASFQLPQPGIDSQAPMPDVPGPDEASAADGYAELQRIFSRVWPFERRGVVTTAVPGMPRQNLVWMKATGRLPDDPLLQACAFTYASDLTPIVSILQINDINRSIQDVRTASLDHAIWFHRPGRADEWLLYEAESPSASGARGLAFSRVFAEDGRQVASTAQEGMIRIR